MMFLALILTLSLLFQTAGLGAIPIEEVLVPDGIFPVLSFPPGECPAHTKTWCIIQKSPRENKDIYVCRNNMTSDDKVEGQCPKTGQNYTIKLLYEEPLNYTLCLEINQILCSCKHLVNSSVDRADPTTAPLVSSLPAPGKKKDCCVDTTTTVPESWILVGLKVLGIFVLIVVAIVFYVLI